MTRRRVPQNEITPLHMTAVSGHPEVAKLLLDWGADITATNEVSERSLGDRGLGIRTR